MKRQPRRDPADVLPSELEGPTPSTSPLELLTVPEVAALLRFTEKGVYAMVSARRIPFVKISNRVRFDRAAVLRWVSESRVPASEKDR